MDGCVGWGDVMTILPYNMYVSYGDLTILREQYEPAKRWVDYMFEEAKKENPIYRNEPQYSTYTDGIRDADFIWDTGFHWGEWSEPNFVHRTLPENFMEDKAKMGEPVVATAYLSYSSGILAKMAELLNKQEDAKKYKALSEKVAAVYDRYFVKEDGTIPFPEAERQAPYVRVLAMHLCSDEKRTLVAKQLVKRIREAGYHLNTGFLSTKWLLNVLVDEGYVETAYRILEQKTSPSWLYPVINGATTTYESWDGVDKFFGSFNHYSLGAVCDFLVRYMAGICPDEAQPGYKHFYLKPVPGGSLQYVKTKFESPFGTIKSEWKKTGEQIEYYFEVPANTSASIVLCDGTCMEVGSGNYNFSGRYEHV